MTPEPVRCIVCLGIKRGKPFTRGGGKRTLRGWVCGRCLETLTDLERAEIIGRLEARQKTVTLEPTVTKK